MGHFNHGRGSGRQIYNTCNRPTYQLYTKYGHSVVYCWYIYDELFKPQAPKPKSYPSPSNVLSNDNGS